MRFILYLQVSIQRRREGQPIPFWVRFESFFLVREGKKNTIILILLLYQSLILLLYQILILFLLLFLIL